MQTINYLPPVLQKIKEIKVLMAGNDTENLKLNSTINDLYMDQFISTTEAAINRYESMLGIIPKGTDTLEERRFRVLAIYNKQLPYTRIVLEQNLTTFCGKSGYKLYLDYSSNVLTVKIALTAKSMYDTVKSYLNGVIPMNLAIDLILLYNQYKLFKQFTHEQLKEFTNRQIREDVII